MVQGSMSCIKYLMFVFNFLFVIAGIILIVVGAIVQTKDVTTFLNSKFVTAPNILIGVGVIIFVIAFFGCCGALKESSCMVTTFGLLLLLIFILEVAGAAAAYVYRGDLEQILRENMQDSIKQNRTDLAPVWNEIQQEMKCCGASGPEDYANYTTNFPSSCCRPEIETCNEGNAYKEGCFEKLLKKINQKIGLVGGVGIGIGVVELFGLFLAWCLAAAIRKEYVTV